MFFNGSLYWVVKRYLSKSSTDNPCFILIFNLSTHVFGKIYSVECCWKTTRVIIYNRSLAVTSRTRDTIRISGIREHDNGAKYLSYITTMKKDRFDMIRNLQPRSDGHLSCQAYNNGLKLLDFGPYCYGETIRWSEHWKRKIIHLSLSSIPI